MMKRGVWMAIGQVGLGGVSDPWGVLFGIRRGDRRRFFTRSVSGAGVASIGAYCCLTPSEIAMRSPSEFGVGSRCDMGRMPGVFARVTLVCVQGAAVMSSVDVGLVELCCVVGSCVRFFSSRAENFRPIVAVPCRGVRGIAYSFGVGGGWLGRVWRQFWRRHPSVLFVVCYSVLGITLIVPRLCSRLWRDYGRTRRGNDHTRG